MAASWLRAAARPGVQGKGCWTSSARPVMSSRWVVREHCLAAFAGLQIDPICAPYLIGAADPTAAHIGGTVRSIDRDGHRYLVTKCDNRSSAKAGYVRRRFGVMAWSGDGVTVGREVAERGREWARERGR